MSKRSSELEWMDQGFKYITRDQYQNGLKKLDQIGRFLRGDHVIWRELSLLQTIPKSILDVGCGAGYLALHLARRFPKTEIIGLDINPEAITFANKTHTPLPKNLHFILSDKAGLDEHMGKFSVITSSLVCHHMTDDQMVKFLVDAKRLSKQAVIINDLHRHWLAYASYFLLAPVVFRNRMITHDGLISIKRSFTRTDLLHLLQSANFDLRDCSIRWYLPFRWGVHIQCR